MKALVRLGGRKLGTLVRLPAFTLLWLLPAWVGMGVAAAAVSLLPFSRLARLFGRNIGPVALMPLAGEEQLRRARQIRTTVALVARHAIGRSDCVPQALLAVAMCRIHGVPAAVHFGLAKVKARGPEGDLDAHAWVVCGPVAIAGGTSFGEFTPVSCFVSGLE